MCLYNMRIVSRPLPVRIARRSPGPVDRILIITIITCYHNLVCYVILRYNIL